MLYNWLFGNQQDQSAAVDNADRLKQQRADAVHAESLADIDARHLIALHLNSLLEYDFYDYTMHLLQSAGVAHSADRVAFVDTDVEQGLLIDGKRRGWFRTWVSFDSEPIVDDPSGRWNACESLFEFRQFDGFFYQEYDSESRPCEPLTYFSEEECAEDNYVVRHYPSHNLLAISEDDDRSLSQIVVTNISVHPGDFCSIQLNIDNDISSVVECLNGRYTFVRYDANQQVSFNADDEPRLCEQLGAPAEAEWTDFVDEHMLDNA
jgi:hypothetical protein